MKGKHIFIPFIHVNGQRKLNSLASKLAIRVVGWRLGEALRVNTYASDKLTGHGQSADHAVQPPHTWGTPEDTNVFP